MGAAEGGMVVQAYRKRYNLKLSFPFNSDK